MHHSNVICVPSDVTHQHLGNKAKEGYLKVESGVTYSSERNGGQNEASIVLDWTNERTIQIVSGRNTGPTAHPPQNRSMARANDRFPPSSIVDSCRYADTHTHTLKKKPEPFSEMQRGNSGKIRTGNKIFLGKFLNSCW